MQNFRIFSAKKFSIRNITFFDGYYINVDKRFDFPESKKRYNSYKLLKFVSPEIDLDVCTNIYQVIKELKEIDKIYTAKSIVAAFSQYTLRLGNNDYSIIFKTKEDYSNLRKFDFTNKQLFYKQFIEQGIDLNLLPDYIERLNTEKLKESIDNFVSHLKIDNFYRKIFGDGNLADKILLKDFIPKLKDDNCIYSFIKAIHTSWNDKPITIDNCNIPIHLIINFEELLQIKGHFNSLACVFQKIKSKIMIDNCENRVVLLLKIRKGHILYLFTTSKENLEILSYFLFLYYSSECRLKRSLLPLNILARFGVKKIQKAYRTKVENNYVAKTNWFAINNPKDERQTFFNEERKINNIL